jgi:uncharacterized phage-associated protein
MKYAQGLFTPKNPDKYVGKKQPIYRSSWELAFMNFCDVNDHILAWASESIHIPYYNPLKQKNTHYIPDFFIKYRNATGQEKAELIEIKPSKETSLQTAGKSVRNQAYAIVNQAKWQAADNWCRNNNIQFRVITEQDIFHNPGKKKR